MQINLAGDVMIVSAREVVSPRVCGPGSGGLVRPAAASEVVLAGENVVSSSLNGLIVFLQFTADVL